MPIQLVHSDITTMKVDAIVNSANKKLTNSTGGVCRSIHQAAGPELEKACLSLGGCQPGKAKITKAYGLSCKYVIHTVCPSWYGGKQNEQEYLFSCYKESLSLAKKFGCKSIAFPLLSSGVLHFPQELAIKIAVSAIRDFLKSDYMLVYLLLFTQPAMKLGKELYPHLVYYSNDDLLKAPSSTSKHASESYNSSKALSPSSPVQQNSVSSLQTKNTQSAQSKQFSPVQVKSTQQIQKISISPKQSKDIPHIQNKSIPFIQNKNTSFIQKSIPTPSISVTEKNPLLTKEIPQENSTLFVYKGLISCLKHKHPIVNATALLKNLNCKDIELNVQHCTSCNRFFISHGTYQHYREKYGTVLGDIRMYTSENTNSYLPDLSLESTLHLCGYSVNSKDNLPEAARHAIIASVIESGFMTKHEIINLLQYLIKLNHSKKTHQNVIQKWNNDLDFTLAYNTAQQKKYQIHSIIPYSHNRYIVQGLLLEPANKAHAAAKQNGKRIFIDDPKYGYGYIVSESDYMVTTKFDNGEIFTMDRSLFNSGFVQVIQQKPQITVLTPPKEYTEYAKSKSNNKTHTGKKNSNVPKQNLITFKTESAPCIHAKSIPGCADSTCMKSIAMSFGKKCAMCKYYIAAPRATTSNSSKALEPKAASAATQSSAKSTPSTPIHTKQPPISAKPKIGCVHLDGIICSLKDSPCKNAESHCLFFKTY